MNYPFIKLFRSAGQYYVYDINKNAVLHIDKNIYEILCKVLKNGWSVLDNENPEIVKEIKLLKEKKYLVDNDIIHEIRNYSSDYYKSCLYNRMRSLVLEVTQNCNFRCNYCPYSSNESHDRTHNKSKMTFETAKKAIDTYFQYSSYQENKSISFYGGEPLLEYDLIKQCIEYSYAKCGDGKITYHMTTNASLLNIEMIQFFSRYNFYMVISIDGFESYHNKNRRYRDSKETFRRVYQSIRLLYENKDKYPVNLMFNSVWDGSVAKEEIIHYFETDSILRNYKYEINQMASNSTMNFFNQTEKSGTYDRYEKLKKWMTPDYNIFEDPDYQYLLDRFKDHSLMPQTYHHAGPCIPGQTKLYVTSIGDFYPCERYSQKCECAKIGNITQGFFDNNIFNLLNYGLVSELDCKKCWAIRLCSMCPMAVNGTDIYSYSLKKAKCTLIKKQILKDLKDICAYVYIKKKLL